MILMNDLAGWFLLFYIEWLLVVFVNATAMSTKQDAEVQAYNKILLGIFHFCNDRNTD